MFTDPRDDHYFEEEWYEDDWDYESEDEQPYEEEGIIHTLEKVNSCLYCRRVIEEEGPVCTSCDELIRFGMDETVD